MNKKITAIVITLMVSNFSLLAQGIRAELYPFNYTFINSSFAGLNGQQISLMANRANYVGAFGDAVETAAFIAYENFFEKINSGISITADAERFGPNALTNYGLSYNYRIKLGESASMIPAIRFRRNIYNIDYRIFRGLVPNDPLIVMGDATEKNWAADASLLFVAGKTTLGVSFDNIIHTNNESQFIGGPVNRFNQLISFVLGTQFELSPTITSQHSLYVPVDMIDLRVDLNNTFTWKNLIIAGATVQYDNDEFYPKFFGGVSIGKYATISTLLYSGIRRDYEPEFRGEVYVAFNLNQNKVSQED